MARRGLGRRGGAAAVEVLTLFRARRAARRADPARRWSASGVDAHRRPRRQAGPGRRSRPLRVRAQPPVDRGRSAATCRGELRIAGPGAVDALARTRRGAEPARVAAAVARRLAGDWYDEGDLLAGAAVEVRAGLPRRFARVIVYLPELVRPLEQALLAAFGAVGSVELVVATCGDEQDDVDHSTAELVERLTGRPLLAAPTALAGEAPKVEVVSTTDADDEVRLAVRALVDGARRGVRFDRMGVVWPTDRPYARMVEHQLVAAGIPWNGRPGTQTAELMVPRVLADLLELDRRGLRRSNLMTLLGDVPARDIRGRPVPTARWERIGRQRRHRARRRTGSVRLHLAHADAAAHRTRRRSGRRVVGGTGGRVARRPRRPRRAPAVGGVGPVVPRPARPVVQPSWARSTRGRRANGLGAHPARPRSPRGTSTRSGRRSPAPSSGRRSSPSWRSPRPATARSVTACTSARSRGAIGLDLDLVVVVGAADGLLPPPPPVDPLLGEADRVAAGLPGNADARRARPPALRRPRRHDARRPGHRAARRSARRRRQPTVALARGGARRRALDGLPRPCAGLDGVPGLGRRAPDP